MEKKFNLNLFVIINEPIEPSDLFNRPGKAGKLSLKPMTPETRSVGS